MGSVLPKHYAALCPGPVQIDQALVLRAAKAQRNVLLREDEPGSYTHLDVYKRQKEDGAKLAGHIKQVYEMPGGRERYWDQVALEYHLKEYQVQVRPCTFDDIIEIDNYSDLKKLDSLYI